MDKNLFVVEKSGRKRAAVEIECSACHVAFLKRATTLTEKNFCSVACKGAGQRNQIDCVCSFCSNIFKRKPSAATKSRSGLSFCGRKCKEAAQRIESGIKAIQPDHYGDISTLYREAALRVFPEICMACGYSEHPELIQVHHIDSDRTNNHIDNLVVLCPTCHWAITLKKATMGPDRIWAWVG